MPRLVFAFVLIAVATSAAAQERVITRSLTCAALQARVARDGTAILASSETAYEAVHLDPGACSSSDETAAPAFEPSADVQACLAGWRCKQRNSDSGQR